MQKKILLLLSLLFICTNFVLAQKKDKTVIVIPPSISHYINYSAYAWANEKKDHSIIKVLDFQPFSENVELISKNKDLAKYKFILEKIFRRKEHVLSESEEKILSE